jgi:hypothetical protein
VKKVTYEYTAGHFHLACKSCSIKPPVYTTQRLSGEDYTLNAYILAANHMNCGSLTRLNCIMKTLQATTFAESYEAKVVGCIDIACEYEADLSVKAAMQRLKEQHIRNVEADGRFNKGRDAKFCTVSLLNQETNEICYAKPNHMRDTPSQNPWKAEDFGLQECFDLLHKLEIELHNFVGDACANHAKQIDRHIAFFKELHESKSENKDIEYVSITSLNLDTWHSQRSFDNAWQAMVDSFTKAIKRANKLKGIHKEHSDIIKWKTVARRQLVGITKRVKQAFQQVTGSIHTTVGSTMTQDAKAELTLETICHMLLNCLVHNDHELCAKVCGERCACVVRTNMDTYFRRTKPDDGVVWEDLPHALAGDPRYNSYTIEREMQKYFAKVGPYEAGVKDVEDACEETEDLTVEEMMEREEEYARLDLEEEEDQFISYTDPLQPNTSVLTHPLAIECLVAFINSKRIGTIVKGNCNCLSTSMIESFNSLICVYAPKRMGFTSSMKARQGMAVLDWNENVGRLIHTSDKTGRRWTDHRSKTYMWQQRVLDRGLGDSLW